MSEESENYTIFNSRALIDVVGNVTDEALKATKIKQLIGVLGGRLATRDEVKAAWNKGAEWCNYGWSANQMAFYPTQKTTWDKLQKIKGHENDCGRPGVNGGYITSEDNLNSLFTMDGLCFSRDSNKVSDALTGVTFNLLQTFSSAETLTVVKDVESVKSSVNEFISKYNDGKLKWSCRGSI